MALKATNPTTTASWKKLQSHFDTIKSKHLKDLFTADANRAKDLTVEWDDFYVDFSKNRITKETLDLLYDLANELDLKDAISKYFEGDIINATEGRAVLHTALRAPKDAKVFVDGENVIPEVHEVKKKIENFTNSIVSGDHKGFSGKAITDVVNIGIGGSDLGPAMVVDSLQYYKNHLNTHFVSNVDGDHYNEVIKNLNPETTLFVIVSKTFTTQETLSNANSIRAWFLESQPQEAVSKHFVAVSTNIESVKNFGIDEDNIFPMKDWVGGRFSLWSAVGLSISLALGYNHFESLLEGAHKMDEHFRTSSFENNIPVTSALLTIWYNNFFKSESEAIIPYTQYLNQFATYLQQGIMESNGKSVDRAGKRVNYETGTIIWGEPGTNSQHAFFQLIHQGTKLIPTDFIGYIKSLHGNKEHHNKLMSNYFAQTEALMNGKTETEVLSEFNGQNLSEDDIKTLTPFKIFEGNKPTTSLLIQKLTPESLGKLIAMYEHKIFVQGVIWNIYSYDQFGVELGKQLAKSILKELSEDASSSNHDASTQSLLTFFKKNC
ncbi:glucose-6-phosphate isomerase [Winogradskyella echinorum]|uniref:Glucose-6-phosphate isomerase n=1 Tax=Winogradskyella echinorum TaxID=538189 RepID=A0ABR6XZP3_9FLAO|nr:glucose-6-phosphate isomerase [Winogradskyella echinorum]MBC3845480.1 glucose-6-phosphate isomerase [Winogradskyella echinorum]MBC5749828.1 glucose-6-phosphate isomerase [Winogradskyella echinorum]